jgi:transcriptional regulator with XRE-family HTH domain
MTQSAAAAGERTLGSRLRDIRGRTTQKALADALGVRAPSISAYENGSLVPPESRLRDYATFSVAKQPERLPTDDALTDDQRGTREDLYQELMTLRAMESSSQPADSVEDLWRFPVAEPVRLVVGQLEGTIHPYAARTDPNFTDLLSFADLDALIELHGHVRMKNPESDVRFVRADRLAAADNLASHIVMIGGPGLNDTLLQIFSQTNLPITQREDASVENGEVFFVEGEEKPNLPTFEGKRLVEDVGLFARLTNPYNTARTLSWCSGTFSRGVYGAVRILTDPDLRDQNSVYLSERFAGTAQFAVLARVPVILGGALTPDLQNEKIRLVEWPPLPGAREVAASHGNTRDRRRS